MWTMFVKEFEWQERKREREKRVFVGLSMGVCVREHGREIA